MILSRKSNRTLFAYSQSSGPAPLRSWREVGDTGPNHPLLILGDFLSPADMVLTRGGTIARLWNSGRRADLGGESTLCGGFAIGDGAPEAPRSPGLKTSGQLPTSFAPYAVEGRQYLRSEHLSSCPGRSECGAPLARGPFFFVLLLIPLSASGRLYHLIG